MPLSKAGRSGVDVYIHTDGDVVPPPKGSNFRAHSFWAGQKRNLTALRERWNCCWRAPANVDSTYKYEILLEVAAWRPGWNGLLTDSDVLIQCSADELRARFKRFGVPLVVSGERRWYPIPAHYADPFGPSSGSWKERYTLRHRRQFYPNSGLIMGTARGFEALASAVRATPRFPCCAFDGDQNGYRLDPCSSCRPIRTFTAPVSCTVEDQACLQVALASKRHAPAHVVDVNSSIFLSLNELTPSDLALHKGRVAFRHTGQVPCVLHSNGHKGVLSYLEPLVGQAAGGMTPWALSPKREDLIRGYAHERKRWQNGVWDRFRLAEHDTHYTRHQSGTRGIRGPL